MLSHSALPLLFLSLLLFLSNPVLTCRTGYGRQCHAAPFVPGHNLGGKGFDIVTLQRKNTHVVDMNTYLNRKGACRLCPNPLHGNKLHKLPVSVVNWWAFSRCSHRNRNSRHGSVSTLLNRYTYLITSSWRSGFNFKYSKKLLPGSRSRLYKYAASRARKNYNSFSIHSLTCSHYRYRLTHRPRVSKAFQRDLKRLSYYYNHSTKRQFRRFIRIYGTHFIRQVELGGQLRRFTAARTCSYSRHGFSAYQVHNCLTRGFALGLGKLKASQILQSCRKILQNRRYSYLHRSNLYDHFTELVGGKGWNGEFSLFRPDYRRFQNWLLTLKKYPDVVRYSLRPIYELVYCQNQRLALKAAIEAYVREYAVTPPRPSCGHNCCPRPAYWGKLVVTIIGAWGLRGDRYGKIEAYARIMYGSLHRRTHVIRSNEPIWNRTFNLGKVNTRGALKVSVWDRNPGKDNRLGSCTVSVRQGTHVHKCSTGTGFFKFKYTLICDRYLTGAKCNRYK